MYKNLEKELEEKYGWLKLTELKGIVMKVGNEGPVEELKDLNLGVMPPNYHFSKDVEVAINLSKPTELTKLFIRVMGPEIIFVTKHFLEESFHNLFINISIQKESREIPIVQEGKLNRRELILMGELKDWMMYYWTKWNTLRFDNAGTLPVHLLIHGKTGCPRARDINFILQLYFKKQNLID